MSFLYDTGSELGGCRGECCVILVCQAFNVVACELTYVICECIANSTSEVDKILCTCKVSCTFKCGDKLVGKIFCINSVSYLCACAGGVKSVGHEVSGTVFISEIFSHIVHEDFSERIFLFAVANAVFNGLKHVHDVVCIKVAVVVFLTESRKQRTVIAGEEVLFANDLDHFFERAVNTVCRGCLKKVNKVACPTGNVCMIQAELIVISDIHRAENVTDISHITVGKLKFLKILKTCNSKIFLIKSCKENLCIVCVFSVGYEFCKVCIFITCHDTPRTGIVSFNTGTDVLDYKVNRILGGILLNINICNLFEKCEIVYEVIVIIYGSFTKCGDLVVRSGFAAFCTNVVSLVTCLCTGRSLSFEMEPIVAESFNEYVCVTKYTYLIFCTSSFCAGNV